MKKLLGAAILLLCAALAALLVLRIWGVSVLSAHTLLRSGASLAVLAGAAVVLIIVWFATYQNPTAGYDPQSGQRAHRKQQKPYTSEPKPDDPLA